MRVLLAGVMTSLFLVACGGDAAPADDAPAAEPTAESGSAEMAVETGELEPFEGRKNHFTLEAGGQSYDGPVLCEVYEGGLQATLSHLGARMTDFRIRASGVEGAGSYDGQLRVKQGRATSTGPVRIEAAVKQGEINPILVADITGDYDGEAGSGSVEGTFACATNLDRWEGVEGFPKSGSWIEYTVSGVAEADRREQEAMMCSNVGDAVEVQSAGGWGIHFELPAATPGEHTAPFRVSAPSQLDLTEDIGTNDPRFYGDGSVTVEEAGQDQMGYDAFRFHFSAPVEQEGTGRTLTVEGTAFCGIF